MPLPLGLLANHTWYCLDGSFYQQASFTLWLNIGGALVEDEEEKNEENSLDSRDAGRGSEDSLVSKHFFPPFLSFLRCHSRYSHSV